MTLGTMPYFGKNFLLNKDNIDFTLKLNTINFFKNHFQPSAKSVLLVRA